MKLIILLMLLCGVAEATYVKVGGVSQAVEVGHNSFGSDCVFTTSSSTYGSPTDASCTATATGSITTVAGIYPAFTFSSTPGAGAYEIVVTGAKGFISGDDHCHAVWSTAASGGTLVSEQTDVLNGNNSTNVFHIYDPTQTTYYMQLRNNSSGQACSFSCSDGNCQITVKKLPSSSQQAVRVGAESAFAARKITASATAVSVTTLATYNNAMFATATNYGKAENPTTANDFGMKVSNIPVGSYRLCVDGAFYHQASTGGLARVILYDGTTIIGQHYLYAYPANAATQPVSSVCGVAVYDSVVTKDFVVRGEVIDGGGSIRSMGDGGFTLSLIPITANIPQPVIVNSVTHSKANQQRIVYGTIDGAGAILKAGTGDWTSARDNTGLFHVTFSPAFADNGYSCVCTARNQTRACASDDENRARTTSVWNYETFVTGTNAYNDYAVDFQCIGNK